VLSIGRRQSLFRSPVRTPRAGFRFSGCRQMTITQIPDTNARAIRRQFHQRITAPHSTRRNIIVLGYYRDRNHRRVGQLGHALQNLFDLGGRHVGFLQCDHVGQRSKARDTPLSAEGKARKFGQFPFQAKLRQRNFSPPDNGPVSGDAVIMRQAQCDFAGPLQVLILLARHSLP
jgi:hypothetical protein